MRKAYSIAGVALLVELAAQFYLIAAAALNVWGADNRDDTAASVFGGFRNGDAFAFVHALNGTFLIPLTILAMIALSFGAGLPSREKRRTAGLFGLMVLQFFLAIIGAGGAALAIIGGLHGVNALAITGLAASLVYRNWAYRAPAGEAAHAAAPAAPALEGES